MNRTLIYLLKAICKLLINIIITICLKFYGKETYRQIHLTVSKLHVNLRIGWINYNSLTSVEK